MNNKYRELNRATTVAVGLALAATSLGQIGTVTFKVNGSGITNPPRISPLVYGANFATQAQALALNLPFNRSGGNATTRYNWQQDSTSSGSDWYFLSHGGGTPSQSVDAFISGNNSSGALSAITVPIIGYVANVGTSGYSWSFSVARYGAQQGTEPYHPDAGNGVHLDGTYVTGNNPADANMAVPITYQQGWINHLISTFGRAKRGGVAYYLLDNEPALWMQTHRDVFPNGVTMSDLFAKERDAASLVKSIDSSALVAGPEEWGWLGYLYSGSDYQWLAAHNWQGTPPDKANHGGLDCVAYLLQQFAAADATAGRRSLDVFSLHYYPQGNFSSSDTGTVATLWRNRATRSLWDSNYTDESWINQKIDLIPRMKNWVKAYYPGTKLGVTEYSWGDDNNMGAAIATADALGIFGRDGISVASRWVCPATGSLTFKVFQMYRNYDGANSTFGNYSVPVIAPDPDTLSAFASQDANDGHFKVMVVHKRPSGNAPVNLAIPNSLANEPAQVYQLTASGGIVNLGTIRASGGIFSLSLPPQSVTLIVI